MPNITQIYDTYLVVLQQRRAFRGREELVPEEKVVTSVHRPRGGEPIGQRPVHLHLPKESTHPASRHRNKRARVENKENQEEQQEEVLRGGHS